MAEKSKYRLARSVETPVPLPADGGPSLYDSGVELRFDRGKLEARVGGDRVVLLRAGPAATPGEFVTLTVANFRFPDQFPPRTYEFEVVG